MFGPSEASPSAAREFRPPRDLEPYVDAFWIQPARTDTIERSIPTDACLDVIFELSAVGTLMPRVFGPTTAAAHVVLPAQTMFAGIRFKPWIGPTLFRSNGSELTNQVIDVQVLAPKIQRISRSTDPLKFARDPLALLTQISRDLATQFDWTPSRKLVRHAVELMAVDNVSVAQLVDQLSVPERTLRRVFATHVGLSPKSVARIIRVQRALSLLRQPKSLVDISAECGFADQSHFTRELLVLGGATPGRTQQR